jgi:Tol biopolymer transport system component
MKNNRLIVRAAMVLFAAVALVLSVTSAGAGAGTASTAVSGAPVGGPGEPEAAADELKGSKIAFSRLCAVSLPPTGCAASVEHQGAEIWTMNGDGSRQTQLTHNTTWDLAPVWSPDGNTIAFYGVQYDVNDKPGQPHIYLVHPDDPGDQKELTYQVGGADMPVIGRFPSFSPDGTKIAFDTGGGASGNIFVTNVDGSGMPTQLTFGTTSKPERNIRPAWQPPDGQKIAFVSRRNGCDDIYVMNPDGTEVTQLTGTPQCDPSSVPNPPADNAPAWSPDGNKIVFQRTLPGADGQLSDGNDEIYVMNADGTDQTRLTYYPGRDDDPDWSPDGRWIAFHRDHQPIDSQILEVFVMNADGSNQIPLTHLPSENAHPAWRPALAP